MNSVLFYTLVGLLLLGVLAQGGGLGFFLAVSIFVVCQIDAWMDVQELEIAINRIKEKTNAS